MWRAKTESELAEPLVQMVSKVGVVGVLDRLISMLGEDAAYLLEDGDRAGAIECGETSKVLSKARLTLLCDQPSESV